MIYLQHFLLKFGIITFTLVNSLQRFALLQVLAISLAVLYISASCIASCNYNYSVYLVISLRRFSILQVLAISLAVLCNFSFVLHHAIILHIASLNFKALHYLDYFELLRRIAFLCVSCAILWIMWNSPCYNSQIYVLAYTIVSNGLQWTKVGTTSSFAILYTIALSITSCITLYHITFNCNVLQYFVALHIITITS